MFDRPVDRLLAAAEAFELGQRFRVEPLAHWARAAFVVTFGLEIREERGRRCFAYLLTGRASNGRVRRDQAHDIATAVLGRKTLDQRVRMARVADGERPDIAFLAATVEHDHPASATRCDEARQLIDKGARILVAARVEEVVAVEEVEGRLGHYAAR